MTTGKDKFIEEDDPETFAIIGAAMEVHLLNFGAPSLQFRRFINADAWMSSEASAQSVQSVDAS